MLERRVLEDLDRDLCSGDDIDRERIVDLVRDGLAWCEAEDAREEEWEDYSERLSEAEEDARHAAGQEERAKNLLHKAHARLREAEGDTPLVVEIGAAL